MIGCVCVCRQERAILCHWLHISNLGEEFHEVHTEIQLNITHQYSAISNKDCLTKPGATAAERNQGSGSRGLCMMPKMGSDKKWLVSSFVPQLAERE